MSQESLRHSIFVATVGFLAAVIAAPLVYRTLLRLGSRQTVSEHVPEHGKKQGTPTMGGLIVVVGVVAAMIADGRSENGFLLILLLWYTLIGFLDDYVVPRTGVGRRGLGWMPKLAMQIVPFIGLWAMAPAAPFWLIATTAFGVMFFANAYNFADGMDGLAGGLGILLALGTVTLSLLNRGASTGAQNVPVLLALALALVPFLFLNAPPARLFMGDVGSLPIGAMLGMGFLQGTLWADPSVTNWNNLWLALPLLCVLLFELIPVPLQIASAKLRKGKRLFPFRTPVHHAFEAAGWPETRVVALFLLVQFTFAVATVMLVAWRVP